MMREWILKGRVAKVVVFPLPWFLRLFFKKIQNIGSKCVWRSGRSFTATSCCFLLNNELGGKSSELNGILFIHNRGRVEFPALDLWEYFGHFPARESLNSDREILFLFLKKVSDRKTP